MDKLQPDAFLAQEIASSSPARLRFLLVQKAVGLCRVVENQWRNEQLSDSVQWCLKIQDILTELLDGIRDPQNPLAKTVSDLYVYTLKLFLESVQTRDQQALATVREILEIDQETWAMFVANEHRQNTSSSARMAEVDNDSSEAGTLDLSL